MDPISILTGSVSLAHVAFKVFDELRVFIRDTKEVDVTVRELQSGIEQVRVVCLLIEKHIRSLPDPENPDNKELFTSIATQIASCASAIHKINSKIENVAQNTGPSFIKQAYRQIRLNMTKDDIIECKAKIQSGVQNLQLSLQLVNLQATYLAPQLANQSLLDKLDNIQKLLTTQNVDLTLQKCAKTYINQGATLYEKSVASSVGGFHSQSRHPEIAEWVDQLAILRLDSHSSDTLPPDDDVFSSPSESLDTTDTTVTTPLDTKTFPGLQKLVSNGDNCDDIIDNEEEDDDNGDEEEDRFAMETVKTALDSGRISYQEARYSEAEEILGDCLALIRRLPEHQRSAHNIDEIHLLLAICAFHLHESAVAETALISPLNYISGTDVHAKLRYEAGFALAIIYVRLEKYEPARFTCENVYRGRRKLLGKEDDLCFESLALLAHIYDLQKLPTRANTYRSMIPEGRRALFCSKTYKAEPQMQSSNTCDENEQEHWTSLGTPDVYAISISAVARIWACSLYPRHTHDARIEIRDVQTSKLLHSLAPSCAASTALCFDSQGRRLASGHGGLWTKRRHFQRQLNTLLTIRVWDVHNGQCLHLFKVGGKQTDLEFVLISYTPKDDQIIMTTKYVDNHTTESYTKGKLEPGLLVIDSTSGAVIHQNGAGIYSTHNFSKDSTSAALVSDYSIDIYDMANYKNIIRQHPMDRIGSQVMYRSDGSLLSFNGGNLCLTREPKEKEARYTLTNPSDGLPTQPSAARLQSTADGHSVVTFWDTGHDNLLNIVAPELGLWRIVPRDSIPGMIALPPNAWNYLAQLSSGAEYLIYARKNHETVQIRVIEVERELKKGIKIPIPKQLAFKGKLGALKA